MVGYNTAKYVLIQDARLGCLRGLFLTLIVVYVVVFEMMKEGGYLQSSPVVGTVRFSLQQPTLDNCDPAQSTCVNNFASLDTLSYCGQAYANDDPTSIRNSTYYGNVYDCEVYEAVNAQLVSEKSISVITRGSTRQQRMVCDSNKKMTCSRTYDDVSPEHKFYTAQSEAFTVLLDHAVTASSICTASTQQHSPVTYETRHYACSSEASNYHGRLLSRDSELCASQFRKGNAFASHRGTQQKEAAPCFIAPNRTSTNQDFFSLDILLQASGIDLDECNPSSKTNETSSCQTYRETGATMLLNIDWTDFAPYKGVVKPTYKYSAQLIVGSAYKQQIPFYERYRSDRTLLNAHGIKIAVLLGGEFHQFNLLTFMITLTTALGLLAVATTLVEVLMLYCLPGKERYREAIYEVHSADFNDGRLDNLVSRARSAGMSLFNPFETNHGMASDDMRGRDGPVVDDEANEDNNVYELLLGSPHQRS